MFTSLVGLKSKDIGIGFLTQFSVAEWIDRLPIANRP